MSPLLWALAAAYHGVLVWTAVRDARRLPLPGRFLASRQLPRPLSLGAEQVVLLGLSCPEAAGLRCAVADHPPAELHAEPRSVEGTFDVSGQLVVEYRLRPPRRGVYDLPALDVRVWRRDGWWSRQFRLPLPDRADVYPDVLAIRRWQLTLRRGVRALPGQRRARPPGAATAPAGLRDYLPGDDVRRIHWKATARRDHPITAELEAERGQQVVLALDCGRLMTAPAGHLAKLDHAVNAALLLAWVAQSQGDRVGLLTFDERVNAFLAPRRGLRQVTRINEILHRVEASYAEPEFGDAFASLARQVRGRALVVVLTDVVDPAASADLVAHGLRLGARHRLLVVAMTDPATVAALRQPVTRSGDAYRWAAAEELAGARRRAFETLQRGGVECLDVQAGRLSPALVERYLELKERGLV
ncbi:MAG TPA: DUF58 domain-containing protein [Candidatus Dormibacteraeota bacterium]|nr:DUF58 domain-containing protein [Candidatus Dormibacteraeota bacterium]